MGRHFSLQVVAAVAIGVLGGVGLHSMGVGASGPGMGEATEVAGARLERGAGVPEDLMGQVEAGVLLVEASGCGEVRQATATVLRRGTRTWILTNAHVVRGAGTATVRAPDGSVIGAQVRGTIAGRDAAVLSVELDDDELADRGIEAIPAGGPVLVGDEVVVAGHPDGTATAEAGRVVDLERRAAYGGSSDVLLVDVEVSGGSSGGALLDQLGRVVGLVAAKDPATGWAVAYRTADVLDPGLGPVPVC